MKIINQLIGVFVAVFNICIACFVFYLKITAWEYFLIFNILSVYAGVKLYEFGKETK